METLEKPWANLLQNLDTTLGTTLGTTLSTTLGTISGTTLGQPLTKPRQNLNLDFWGNLLTTYEQLEATSGKLRGSLVNIFGAILS